MCSRILIIEDDVLIRDELKILLENEGYSADCVTEFENIPDQIRQISPDLILLVRAGPCFHCGVFRVPKNGTLKTNKPPAMQVSQHCFSLQ